VASIALIYLVGFVYTDLALRNWKAPRALQLIARIFWFLLPFLAGAIFVFSFVLGILALLIVRQRRWRRKPSSGTEDHDV
jgi:heme/copper-type cytochrome/quinol oxidase subunit 2